jgi:hypothetical protein
MEIAKFRNQDDAYQFLVACRIERESLEEQLKESRERSRAYVLQAVIEQGLSVAKAAELSGHHRQSITLWLQIHNAEQKGRAERDK